MNKKKNITTDNNKKLDIKAEIEPIENSSLDISKLNEIIIKQQNEMLNSLYIDKNILNENKNKPKTATGAKILIEKWKDEAVGDKWKENYNNYIKPSIEFEKYYLGKFDKVNKEDITIACECGKQDKCIYCHACISNVTKHKKGHFVDCKSLGGKKDMSISNSIASSIKSIGKPKVSNIKCSSCNEKSFCKNCGYCINIDCIFGDNSCIECVEYKEYIKKNKKMIVDKIELPDDISSKKECNGCISKYCIHCGGCLTKNCEYYKISCDYCTKYKSISSSSSKDNNMKATYTKLSNGVWAIKTTSADIKPGCLVSVYKKNGDVETETIAQLHSTKYHYENGEKIIDYIYTIEKKYKKAGYIPSGSIKQSKKVEQKYDMLVWESTINSSNEYNKKCNSCKGVYYYDTDYNNIQCPKCNKWLVDYINIDNYELKNELVGLTSKSIDALLDIYSKQGDKYVVATRYNERDILSVGNYAVKYYGDIKLISQLVLKYVAKKEAIENVDKTWIMCNMSCNDFPARSQKIKGIRELGYNIKNLVDTYSIIKAIVVTENLDIENVIHKHSYDNKRVKLDAVLNKVTGKFMRPCPQNPEHGFVDSRLVNTRADAIEVIEEIRKTGELPEFIVMDKIECEYSGVINPDRITFGRSNDGATSGKDAFEIPFILSPDGKNQLVEMFWNNKEKYCSKCHKSYTIYENTQVDLVSCLDCVNVKLERKWPFIELLYNYNTQPILVQLRSGPELKVETEKIKVKYIYELNSNMDLIEWGKKSKELQKDITIGSNGKYSRECPVVWHSGGALGSHFGVHCRETGLPYVTSKDKPVENSIIEIGVKEDTNLNALREGLVLGLETKLRLDSDSGFVDTRKDLKNFLAALHSYAIADLGNEDVARFVGYSWAIGARIIAALPFGEATHRAITKDRTASVIGDMLSHERDYNKVWNKELDKIVEGLVECYNGFLLKKDRINIWSSSYGGIKWAICTDSLLNVFVGIRDFLKSQTKENLEKLVNSTNEMVNLAHNNGWWLNKLLKKSDFDDASMLPHFFFNPDLAFRLRDEYDKSKKFGLKVRAFELAKVIKVEEWKEARVIEEIVVEKAVEMNQDEIKELIVKDSDVIAQYNTNGASIHIQIKCFVINRDYGFSGIYNLDEQDYQYKANLKKFYNNNEKASWLVNSLTDSATKYSPCKIHKSSKKGYIVVETLGYVMVQDNYLWEQLEKVKKWQSDKGDELFSNYPIVDGDINKKALDSIFVEEEVLDSDIACCAVMNGVSNYYCTKKKGHKGNHIATYSYWPKGKVLDEWPQVEDKVEDNGLDKNLTVKIGNIIKVYNDSPIGDIAKDYVRDISSIIQNTIIDMKETGCNDKCTLIKCHEPE